MACKARPNKKFIISFLNVLFPDNNERVLENLHCAQAFLFVHDPQNHANIFKSFLPSESNSVRETIISMVLATALSDHKDFLQDFELLVQKHPDCMHRLRNSASHDVNTKFFFFLFNEKGLRDHRKHYNDSKIPFSIFFCQFLYLIALILIFFLSTDKNTCSSVAH